MPPRPSRLKVPHSAFRLPVMPFMVNFAPFAPFRGQAVSAFRFPLSAFRFPLFLFQMVTFQ